MYPPRRSSSVLSAHPYKSKSSIRIRPGGDTSRSDFKMPRRQFLIIFALIVGSFFLAFEFVWTFRNQAAGTRSTDYLATSGPLSAEPVLVDEGILKGTATAPKLENATLKAELGNAAWKVLHTTMAKFPDKPTADDSSALKSYIYLFARLYPCGECARHFQQILSKFPPQVATRSTAAAWACHVHNEVNKSLQKTLFDCSKIGDFYDCGCADDEKPGEGKREFTPLVLDKEGLTRGG